MIDKIIDRLKAITNDSGWVVKVIIGGLLSYIPVLGWAPVFGYLNERISKEDRENLPVWGNIEKLFMDGLPTALLMTALCVILTVVNAVLNSIVCIGSIISLILSIGFALIIPAVIVSFMLEQQRTGDWKTALNIQAIIDLIKSKFNELMPELITFLVLTIIAVIVGCCGILAPVTVFYVSLVYYPVFADILKGGEVSAPAAAEETTPAESESAPAEEVKEPVAEEKAEDVKPEEKKEEEAPQSEEEKPAESDDSADEDDSSKKE